MAQCSSSPVLNGTMYADVERMHCKVGNSKRVLDINITRFGLRVFKNNAKHSFIVMPIDCFIFVM